MMDSLFLSRRPSDRLWSFLTHPAVLTVAVGLVLFFMLGAKEIWTQEWRWANICSEMMLRHDYFHPFLANRDYYDKPLLSYWLMIAFSYVVGGLNVWAIRLPNAVAGALVVAATFCVAKKQTSKDAGYFSAWMLISSFMFVYWSRIASADMLNVAGIMLAVAWYFARKKRSRFLDYFVFFIILAIASLMKGVVAAAVTFVVLLPDLLYQHQWKKHFNFRFVIASLLGLCVYLLPFVISSHLNPGRYQESGLSEVIRENFVRYLHPYDHEGPIYTYLLFLPLYVFPWILFLIPALISLPARWRRMTPESRWMVWAFVFVFLFFTLSGSRRNYYVLPIMPFAILVVADWVVSGAVRSFRRRSAIFTVAVFYFVTCFSFCVMYPIAYSGGGIPYFTKQVRQEAIKRMPWGKWQIVMLDAKTKTSFYLKSPHLIVFMNAIGDIKFKPNRSGLMKSFPLLGKERPDPHRILILRESYLPYLKDILPRYQVILMKRNFGDRLIKRKDPTAPVALIPKARGRDEMDRLHI